VNALDAAPLLRCPLCAGDLDVVDRTLRCPAGHAFDVARNGSVTLAGGGGLPEGDTAEMLAARARFLGGGHYAPIAEVLRHHARGDVVVDCGAGTGWYLTQVVGETGVAVDTSAAATKAAARAHDRVVAVRADVWSGLPLRDAVADIVLVVFSPRNGAEFARVLRPGGVAVTVTPTERHLQELREELGLLSVPEDKRERLERAMVPLVPVEVVPLEWELLLDGEAVRDLVAMGPNARHGMRAPAQPRRATASVEVTVFRHG
jgi:23S rRNA (guanine745-N1)-methyltransferase